MGKETAEKPAAIKILEGHATSKELLKSVHASPEELKKIRDHVMSRSVVERQEMKAKVLVYRGTVEAKKKETPGAPELKEHDEAEKALKAIEEEADKPDAPKPTEAKPDEGPSSKIASGGKKILDKAKAFMKDITDKETWSKTNMTDKFDKIITGALALFEEATEWFKGAIAPILVKFKINVPGFLMPTAAEIREVRDPIKKFVKTLKVTETDPEADKKSAVKLKEKEREYIKKNTGIPNAKEQFYTAIEKQILLEEPDKKSSTLSEFVDAAEVILPSATPAVTPAEDPDVKLEASLTPAAKKAIETISKKDASVGEIESSLKEITPSMETDILAKFSKGRRDKIAESLTLHIAKTTDATKTRLEAMKKNIS